MDSPATTPLIERSADTAEGDAATADGESPRGPLLPLVTSVRSFVFPRRRRWEPQCSHSTMGRLYHSAYKCEGCGRTDHFGWVYRCTMDREALIMGAKENGLPVTFDLLGDFMSKYMGLGKFGPDVRSKKYSFLKEITPEQLQTYTPTQLLNILEDRDNVQETIQRDRRNVENMLFHDAKQKYPDARRPWIPTAEHECQYKACHRCHRYGKDKSWVSLDGILNGDTPPTVATGFSFSHQGSRPVVDPNIAKNLGYRAVPLPRRHPSRRLKHKPGLPALRPMAMVDEHLEEAVSSSSSSSQYSFYTDSDSSDESFRDYLPPTYPLRSIPSYQVTHYQENYDGSSSPDDHASARESIFEPHVAVRPPWTPPPTPTPTDVVEDLAEETPTPNFSDEPVAYGGRSPSSLKTNPVLRRRVLASVPSNGQRRHSHWEHVCHSNIPSFPYQTEEMCDVGLFLPFNEEVYDMARNTPLPDPTLAEYMFFARCQTIIEATEDEDSSLSEYSCDITSAVALTEEAIESGMANVVAHEQ
ncbi:hypothetical protein QBC47DRAFT_395927 [Echria macrotheca]|uniref:Uncharacterized protein n=1 Tax=Echria macrotheca TaxID=438768 RepID=A0AAJ0B211_9PEZI|nr:hypothetical protein QBC47DRAFT_395927 [Echria macrotheca]